MSEVTEKTNRKKRRDDEGADTEESTERKRISSAETDKQNSRS